MKTDSRLATLEPSSMIRGSHDCLEKVLWAFCAPEKAGRPFMTKNGTPFTPAILSNHLAANFPVADEGRVDIDVSQSINDVAQDRRREGASARKAA